MKESSVVCEIKENAFIGYTICYRSSEHNISISAEASCSAIHENGFERYEAFRG
jgi:hypothetical protein